MLGTIGLSLLVAVAPAAASGTTRTLQISVVDAKGQAVQDLKAREVVVLDDGVACQALELSRDKRPISLALVLDSSEVLGPHFRSDLVPAVRDFVRRFPEDTRFALWTSGARPTLRIEPTTDARELERALEYVVPEGGNTLMDTIDQALDALTAAEGRRLVLVIVTESGVEFSSQERPRAADHPERRGDAEIHAIQIAEAGAAPETAHPDEQVSPVERQANYEQALSKLTSATGGRQEHLLLASATPEALERIAAEVFGSYLLRYAARPGHDVHRTKLEVARPGVKVRHRVTSQGN